MRTWDNYKQHVKALSDESRKDMEEVESIASIVGAFWLQKMENGLLVLSVTVNTGMIHFSKRLLCGY